MRRLALPMQVSVDGFVGPNGDWTGLSGLLEERK
jgi:hypothetical protein